MELEALRRELKEARLKARLYDNKASECRSLANLVDIIEEMDAELLDRALEERQKRYKAAKEKE
jgi:hypothetical protein